MHLDRRDVMFAFAASAALGGCATPWAPAADWQQFSAGDGTAIHPIVVSAIIMWPRAAQQPRQDE